MTGIAEFLTARLDEDEATAQHSGPARVAWLAFLDDAGHMRYTTVAASNDDDDPWVADGHELVAPAAVRVVYDPARVLAEVAAKRALLKRLDEDADACTDDAEWRGASLAEWQVIAHLAAVYADHPDYDPSWRVPTTEENDHG